jgi:uncharacterized membrane protein YgdD (TMEM256/DUF423 family)
MRLARLPAVAATICAASVALGAYASHVALAQDQKRLALAALFAFAHGLALIVLSSRDSRLAGIGRLVLLAGVVLFSGSLASAGLISTSTAAAPLGGSLLILGWLLVASDYWRKP